MTSTSGASVSAAHCRGQLQHASDSARRRTDSSPARCRGARRARDRCGPCRRSSRFRRAPCRIRAGGARVRDPVRTTSPRAAVPFIGRDSIAFPARWKNSSGDALQIAQSPVSMYAPNGGLCAFASRRNSAKGSDLQARAKPVGVVDLIGVAGPDQLLELVEDSRVLLGRHRRLPALRPTVPGCHARSELFERPLEARVRTDRTRTAETRREAVSSAPRRRQAPLRTREIPRHSYLMRLHAVSIRSSAGSTSSMRHCDRRSRCGRSNRRHFPDAASRTMAVNRRTPAADAIAQSDSSISASRSARSTRFALSGHGVGRPRQHVRPVRIADRRRQIDAIAPSEDILHRQQHEVRARRCRSARGCDRGPRHRNCADSKPKRSLLFRRRASPTRQPAARYRGFRSSPPRSGGYSIGSAGSQRKTL